MDVLIIISYDISDDKLRTNFSKYLSCFGHRIQYSVFEIDNSTRILNNILADIKNRYERKFSQEDSIIVFVLSKTCKTIRYGYAKNEENNCIVAIRCLNIYNNCIFMTAIRQSA